MMHRMNNVYTADIYAHSTFFHIFFCSFVNVLQCSFNAMRNHVFSNRLQKKQPKKLPSFKRKRLQL